MKEQFIRLRRDQLLPPVNARPVSEQQIKSMIAEIEAHGGPFQPPGVVKLKDMSYRIVWGNTRTEATWQAGFEDILVRVLPEGTTEADELKYSLIENHDRTNENFEVVLDRLSAYSQKAGIAMKDAAKLAKISPSVVSRWQKCSDTLSPEVKALAKEKQIGLSVLYLLTKLTDPAKQLKLLKQYIAGELPRDALAESVKPEKKKPIKAMELGFNHQQTECKIKLPAQGSYESVLETLAEVKSHILSFQKKGIPLELLPAMLTKVNATVPSDKDGAGPAGAIAAITP